MKRLFIVVALLLGLTVGASAQDGTTSLNNLILKGTGSEATPGANLVASYTIYRIATNVPSNPGNYYRFVWMGTDFRMRFASPGAVRGFATPGPDASYIGATTMKKAVRFLALFNPLGLRDASGPLVADATTGCQQTSDSCGDGP